MKIQIMKIQIMNSEILPDGSIISPILLFFLLYPSFLQAQKEGYFLALPIENKRSWTSDESRKAVTELLTQEKFAFEHLQKILMVAHPSDVDAMDIYKRVIWEEKRVRERHQVMGMITPITYFNEGTEEKYRYNRGGDHALFTGIYLAGLTFQYLSTQKESTLENIAQTVDSIYKMTHISGTPGFLVRLAIPLDIAIRKSDYIPSKDHSQLKYFHIYYKDPAHVRSEYQYMDNIVAGQQGIPMLATSDVARALDQDGRFYGDTLYYTRTTRDQMSGIVFGLAVATYFFEEWQMKKYLHSSLNEREKRLIHAIRQTLSQTAMDIYQYLVENNWEMQDPKTPDDPGTMAGGIDELMKLAVQMLYRRALMNTYPPEYNLTESQIKDIVRKNFHEKNVEPTNSEVQNSADSLNQNISRWKKNVTFFKHNEDAELLPKGIRTSRSLSHFFTSTAWFGLTWNYYAWNLRNCRIFAIMLLDDIHPTFYDMMPDVWPKHTLHRDAVNKRNRYWMEFWDTHIWRYVYLHSNPWMSYLYNFMRRIVLERHYGNLFTTKMFPKSVYAMTLQDFQRILKQEHLDDSYNLGNLFYREIAKTVEREYLGTGLARTHFHLKSVALWPIRSYPSPCQFLNPELRKHYKTNTYESVYLPHLRGFSRFWSFQCDPRYIEFEEKPDYEGRHERTLLDLGVVFWLSYFSGSIQFQFDAYEPTCYQPIR